MSDTPERTTEGGVLRPFVEPEVEPLPVADPPIPAAPEPEAAPAEPVARVATEKPVATEPSIPPPDSSKPAAGHTAVTDPAPRRGLAGAADDSSPAALIPELGGSDVRTVTFSRTTFFIGLAVVVAGLIGLAALWQSAGGGDDAPTLAADIPVPIDSDGVVIDTSDTDALAAALAEQTDRADVAESRAGELETRITELEELLADQPIPALPASALERIIVNTDPQFVSATNASVAVVGPFGGYANIDPASNTVTASGQIGTEATRVLRTPTTVWATNYNGNELVRLDPVTNQIVGTLEFPGPDGVAKFSDTLLVASYADGFIGRVDPSTSEIVARAEVGGNATAVAATDNRIYAAVFETGEVVKIDPDSFEVVDRVIVGSGPIGLAVGGGDKVWVSNRNEGTVSRVDFETGEILTVPVGAGPVEVMVAFGSVWVAVAEAGELVQVQFTDAGTFEVVTRTPLGGEPTGLSFGAGSLWVAVVGDKSVVRVTI